MFDENREGRDLVSSNTHRLEFETYRFLGRWVTRDINEGRRDTEERLKATWLNQLGSWRKTAKRIMVLNEFMIIALFLLGVLLGIRSEGSPGVWLVIIILHIVINLLSYRYQSNKIGRINDVIGYTKQAMELTKYPDERRLAIEAVSQVKSQKLKEYMDHYASTGYLSCQLRGLKEYAQLWLYCRKAD